MYHLKIIPDISIHQYTTLKLGGVAKYLAVAKNAEAIAEAVLFAAGKGLPLVPLGEGSNLIVADQLPDLVFLKMENTGYEILENTATGARIRVHAGHSWDDFVAFTVGQSLSGIEALSMIPGTVGATPVQNVGAYGQEVSNVIESVRIFDMTAKKFREIDTVGCEFSYRDSIFKRQLKRNCIIESVIFKLSKALPVIPDYPNVSGVVAQLQLTSDDPLILIIRKAVMQIRSEKLPDPKQIPNAGSFFKNPFVDQLKLKSLLADHPSIPHFIFNDTVKISAGWLIENAGLKGYEYNGVAVYNKNALVLVNRFSKETKHLFTLAGEIQQTVYTKFGIHLEIEPEIIS